MGHRGVESTVFFIYGHSFLAYSEFWLEDPTALNLQRNKKESYHLWCLDSYFVFMNFEKIMLCLSPFWFLEILAMQILILLSCTEFSFLKDFRIFTTRVLSPAPYKILGWKMNKFEHSFSVKPKSFCFYFYFGKKELALIKFRKTNYIENLNPFMVELVFQVVMFFRKSWK